MSVHCAEGLDWVQVGFRLKIRARLRAGVNACVLCRGFASQVEGSVHWGPRLLVWVKNAQVRIKVGAETNVLVKAGGRVRVQMRLGVRVQLWVM